MGDGWGKELNKESNGGWYRRNFSGEYFIESVIGKYKEVFIPNTHPTLPTQSTHKKYNYE